ncbi:MAG: benzoate-CoA ligase family protein [Planctomycetes bacterium]|nr:benzoate-CoA ligase family protein [Planctomycetota bacterium]
MSAAPQAWPEFPERFNLCEYYLDRHADEGRAEKVALYCEGEERTYGELIERVRRLTAAFRRLGARPEERVLIVLPDCFEFAETWFATLRAGCVFAMVNPLLHREQFDHYLEYTKARIVVTSEDVLGDMEPAFDDAPWCEHLIVVGSDSGGHHAYEELIAAEQPDSTRAACAPTGPDDLAGWLFTSGSTGMPKACVHTHGDFASNTELYALNVVGYREDDVCISVPKLFFGYATGTNLMFPFRVGASAVLFSGRSTADALFDLIERHKPTFLTGVPTMFNNMLNSDRIDGMDLSSLRLSLSAGEALPAELYERWKARTDVEILDGIGSAEMFHIYVSNAPGDVKLGSLGKVVPGYEVEIVDPQGAPLPVGESGRLRVNGPSTALCYWGDKRKSNETFQGAWCTTGDIFRCDADGYYYYEGRADDLLKISGIWVSPLEIENALLGHEAVAEVCVIGREEDGLMTSVACVVLTRGFEGNDETAALLKAHVKERLAPYKYPRRFEWHAELPKNDRGKIARKLLK